MSTPAFGRILVVAALPPPRSYCAAPPSFRAIPNLPLLLPQCTQAIHHFLPESLIVCSQSLSSTAYRDDDIDQILLSGGIVRQLRTDRSIDVPALR
jgi:hypothetical protein